MAYYYAPAPIVGVKGVPLVIAPGGQIGHIGAVGIVGSGIHVHTISGMPYAMGITHPGAIQALLPPPPTIYTSSLPPYGYGAVAMARADPRVHPGEARAVIDSIIRKEFPKKK